MNLFNVEIQVDFAGPWPEGSLPKGVASLLTAAAVVVLEEDQVEPPADLTILLTDDEALHQMNRDFLGVDAPTDVLSFPAGEVMPGMEEAGMALYLGDIAISVPRAAAQAAAAGHSLEAELQLLAVHGVLHLLGFDHADPEEKAAMWQAQTAALSKLGSEITGPAE